MVPAIAFGIGLVFGLTFDTTGPRIPRRMKPVPAGGAQPRPTGDGEGGEAVDEDRRVRLEDDEPAQRPSEPVEK
jgi:hypothetical protein